MVTAMRDMDKKAEWLRGFAEERHRARRAARAFVDAARHGDVDQLLAAVDWINQEADAWRLAMRGVVRLGAVSADIRVAFLSVWIESKHLPLEVGDRPTMAKAARVLFPGYTGPQLRLFRGTIRSERTRRLYGFSWTTQRDVAMRFAQQHSKIPEQRATQRPDGSIAHLAGVVLETVAPPAAILLLREEEGYYDEGEVVLNPYRLGAVTVAGGPS